MDELGRFKLRGELGSGPQAVVYDAQDGGKRCALKVLNEGVVPKDPIRRAGLVGALKDLKKIEHPSAVKVLDGGEEAGRLFVAMELMTCPTLEEKLAQQPSLPEQQVVLFVRQIAQALDKARDLGFYHGDLSPRNLFVVSEEKIKASSFAVKGLIENPPLAQEPAAKPSQESEEAEDEWVTAEDLLRAKSKRATGEKLDEDFTGLAALMMKMFGAQVPDRAPGSALEAYRESLLRGPFAVLSGPESAVSSHTAEVIRRLLTPGGFDSPGEVVVEMASAMLLRRNFGRAKSETPTHAEPSSVTMQVPATPEPAARPSTPGDLSALEFRGDPRAAAFTPFFVWTDRRSGKFFVVHDGDKVSIGRDPDQCDVAIVDVALSRRHCTMSKDGAVIRIEDLGSSNGTFVNEKRVRTAEIQPGDKVRIGTTRLHMSLTGRES